MQFSLQRLVALMFLLVSSARAAGSDYHVGIGKADITGPAADVNMMGYAMLEQIVSGIHTRLYARAYIVADPSQDSNRFVFVNLDACMASQAVTLGVIERLKAEFGDMYTERNVAISGIHTHSGPGGYLQYVLYDITSLGFVKQSWEAVVSGIVESIRRAHANVKPGKLRVNTGELLEANANRSPSAYLHNPEEERARYQHNTDKIMTQLSVSDSEGKGTGAISWFPVHCTSINNTNDLISGDNKGVASQYLEKWAAKQSPARAGSPAVGELQVTDDFVAAFGQANVGDTSPNIQGAFCQDTGLPCEDHSLCNGRNKLCIARGPAWPDNFRSNEIIAQRQADKARELLTSASEEVSGPIDFRHAFLDMTNIQVREGPHTRAGRTCPAAMGFSFAAGTTDGPGAFDFKQGDTNGTIFWKVVGHFLHNPTESQTACQAPKPILLDTGNAHIPYEWQPSIVEIQILRVGQFVILCVPGELTTMAGRRLREAVQAQVQPSWGNVTIAIAGLTNTYSSYVTTFEEYQAQRYEGASTIFGPHTLDAYIQEFLRLADDMAGGRPTDSGPTPPNMIKNQWSFLPPVVIDTAPIGSHFGTVVHDVLKTPYHVNDTVTVTFQSACPRNNVRTGDTFLAVQKLQDDTGEWITVYTDNDISTKLHWQRPHMLSSESTATVTWKIPPGTEDGTYMIWNYGDYKHLTGGIVPFTGHSSSFTIGQPKSTLWKALQQFRHRFLWL
uniref:Neutral ceramidase n=1 Tax=Trebouxia lynnae TaxID=1825957 RepID=A0A7L9QEH6_9CHLO|nr:putative extracellular protein TR9_024 [Trebouxia lynnae]